MRIVLCRFLIEKLCRLFVETLKTQHSKFVDVSVHDRERVKSVRISKMQRIISIVDEYSFIDYSIESIATC